MTVRSSLRAEPLAWACAVVVLGAVAAVAFFDLGTGIPISYEVFLRWSAQGVAAGRGLHLWPTIGFWALPQVYLGAATAALHLDPRAMRLTVLPFLLSAGWGEYLVARQIGASRWWASAVAMLLVCSPLTLALATGFSSDVPYLGLFVVAVATGLRWVTTGRQALVTIGLVLVALLQRQYGLGLLMGVTAGLAVASRLRTVARAEWLILASGWLAALAAFVTLGWTGVTSENTQQYSRALLSPPPAGVLAGAFETPVLVAFVGLPLLLPLAASRARRVGRRQLVAFGLAVYALAMCGMVLAGLLGPGRARSILPGDWVTQIGIGPAHLPGAKPPLFSAGEFALLELATLALVALAFGWRADAWTMGRRNLLPAAYLTVVAVSQFPAIYIDAIMDRHFLPEIALALPVLAVALTRSSYRWERALRAVRASVLLGTVLEVGIFACGEQDLQAWLVASRSAAEVEMAVADPSRVDAGPLNDALVDVPAYDASGVPPRYPRPIDLYQVFAEAGDPRPGFVYRSRAPGKIVVVCAPRVAVCPFPGRAGGRLRPSPPR